MIEAKVVADSISPGCPRITTVQYRAPRCILAEINTHRAFSRNARSSRAVPTSRLVEEVRTDPFIPLHVGANQPGMQAHTELDDRHRAVVLERWLQAARDAAEAAEFMARKGAHKQVVNRILEPFMWVDGLITATEWKNFFTLRCHPDAEPHMRLLAEAIRDAIAGSTPVELHPGEWHAPYATPHEAARLRHPHVGSFANDILFASAARCARVSYAPFDGTKADTDRDAHRGYDMATRTPPHANPFEHVATPIAGDDAWSDNPSNYVSWGQLRHVLLAYVDIEPKAEL